MPLADAYKPDPERVLDYKLAHTPLDRTRSRQYGSSELAQIAAQIAFSREAESFSFILPEKGEITWTREDALAFDSMNQEVR